ncbi:hypothetical protein PGH12_05985 [Chryseobacterium wangxinyae]|uniref:hypothetical protein n=1 Tax=Chryseobacterium sp. CY350 TaxID=2997336 RepID=UPI00226E8F5E|nr:hypothetical protein [Chryseobacterium sp. CY350]MCY0976697.1 hypothetical protein [Chryseobacterium sp. CY350]WBZ96698.1 hypothetical protein PGH12_05985 [Chryseobacterium sp. CY350]
MRNFFLILLCFTSTLTLSQEYHFDYFVKEKSTDVKPIENVSVTEKIVNSETGTTIYLWNKNNKITGILYVDNNKLKHVFNVRKLNNQFNFIYKHSSKINQDYQPKTPYVSKQVFQIKKIDSLKYNIVVFKNSKSKKWKINAIVNLEKAEFEDIEFKVDHVISNSIEAELKKLLDSNFKFITRKIDYKYSNGKSFSTYIENVQKINLTLVVPKILKEPTHWSDFED